MIKTKSIWIVPPVLLFSGLLMAETLKDPYSRDEDISNTQVSVEINRDDNGLYVYEYTVVSSLDNKGEIASFRVDLSCDVEFEPVSLPSAEGMEGYIDISAYPEVESLRQGGHTPASVFADYGNAADYGIGVYNKAGWLIVAKPGDTSTGLRLISPASPGMRWYQLEPSMDTEGWDYSGEPGDAPWIWDFTVTGMIPGPGCPGVTEPVETATFPGTGVGSETEAVNELLVYSEPMKDRRHVGESVEQVTLTVHYAEEIDPKSFKVEPGWARPLFNPTPGESETVMLTLRQAINKFTLSVSTEKEKEKGTRKERALHHSRTDRDVFEIRRAVAKRNNPPGQNR